MRIGMIDLPSNIPPVVHLWVDDERPMPESYNFKADNAPVAIAIIEGAARGHWILESISLDHDLGDFENGYDIACKIEELAYYGSLPKVRWTCHSMNPVGRSRIIQAMVSAEQNWEKKK